jgi:hypothetical protein
MRHPEAEHSNSEARGKPRRAGADRYSHVTPAPAHGRRRPAPRRWTAQSFGSCAPPRPPRGGSGAAAAAAAARRRLLRRRRSGRPRRSPTACRCRAPRCATRPPPWCGRSRRARGAADDPGAKPRLGEWATRPSCLAPCGGGRCPCRRRFHVGAPVPAAVVPGGPRAAPPPPHPGVCRHGGLRAGGAALSCSAAWRKSLPAARFYGASTERRPNRPNRSLWCPFVHWTRSTGGCVASPAACCVCVNMCVPKSAASRA